MTFVIHKADGEACIIWSGISTEGRAFVMNPSPVFPVNEAIDGAKDDNWNL